MIHATADEAPVYRLCAVVIHMGFSFFGHYVAYVQSSTGQWYLADDSRITMVPVSQVMTSQAYLLIYQQIPSKYKPFDTTSIESVKKTVVSAFHPELCKPQQSSTSSVAEIQDMEGLDDETKAALAMSIEVSRKEEEKPKTPQMCPTGCGFYGSEATRGYCSNCFRRKFPKEAEKQEQERKQRQLLQEKANLEMKLQRLEAEKMKAAAKPPVATTTTTTTTETSSGTESQNSSSVKANVQAPKVGAKVPRNALCPCGSGLKYKQCHGKMN